MTGPLGDDIYPRTAAHDIRLWAVRRGPQEATAWVREWGDGRELRVVVGATVMWARLFRDNEDSCELGALADGTLADFERVNWYRVLEGDV
jgi:hypothetical protein